MRPDPNINTLLVPTRILIRIYQQLKSYNKLSRAVGRKRLTSPKIPELDGMNGCLLETFPLTLQRWRAYVIKYSLDVLFDFYFILRYVTNNQVSAS